MSYEIWVKDSDYIGGVEVEFHKMLFKAGTISDCRIWLFEYCGGYVGSNFYIKMVD